ncbi:MAG: hypothetical protein UX77_C0001G0020 [Parcubacteria group bacterium GW2011_GWA1_47_11]|uniref:Uncharacterized protein n=1 Tax=Candidatus Colwellbacteria bacterium GWA2_46_10 TaxID=1797684 RepID=A0A1G1YX51_9BACT|nr:MAG: hypothetical protein UX29_C0014G0023 [Parcubacteria group bacterium GW2011_GWA2_46_10]KKU56347.1 MAG: hypothetical protein UX77_C0001G0020 [Parcubacteria group bacterium GW2011_GWA1_47_11]OGY56884.1 MAG: hypothetical protein A2119_00720 [Candidatus Colwellbacteria bacterium GWA2_46_10]
MDKSDIRQVVKIMSVSYLYEKSSVFPSEEEIAKESARREQYLEFVLQRDGGGELAFKKSSAEAYNDPPEDFK